MKTPTHLAISFIALATFIGCERRSTVVVEVPVVTTDPVAKTRTFETAHLASAIDTFEKAPSALNQAAVRTAFAELDGEIAELDERVVRTTGRDREEAATKVQNLRTYRAAESVRFAKAQTLSGLGVEPATDARSGADKIGDAARDTGEAVGDGAKKVGNAIERAVEKTGDAIKDATR